MLKPMILSNHPFFVPQMIQQIDPGCAAYNNEENSQTYSNSDPTLGNGN